MSGTGTWLRRGAAAAVSLPGLLALGWAGYAASTWARYGRPVRSDDVLLARVMPEFEVVDEHEVQVDAPASLVYELAVDADLGRSPIVRAIFSARDLLMPTASAEDATRRGLRDQALARGWSVLAEEPGHELVMGAVSEPWLPNAQFRGLEPAAFTAFDEPGHAKIVWAIRVDPTDPRSCLLRTETRVATTDAGSRARFRRYWAAFSAAIALIRLTVLREIKRAAEARAAHGSLA